MIKIYCSVCGKEILDEAIICPGCGCMVKNSSVQKAVSTSSDSDKKTQVSLILGIVGIVFAWLFALVGHITSIIGIVIGIKEYRETNKMTGLVLSIIGEVCSVFSSIIGATMVLSAF